MRKMKILVKPRSIARRGNNSRDTYARGVFISWQSAVHSKEFLRRTNNLRITCWRFELSSGKRQDYCSGKGVVLLAAIEERSR
jgi:hypothetical protein